MRQNYSTKVANALGWRGVGYQPETRYMTSGTKAWVTEKVFSGPLDRMWSGYQKVSAWEGIGAINTFRYAGTVMTGTVTPTANMMTPYRTQRALKVSSQGDWFTAPGQVQANEYYAEVGARANAPQVSTARKLAQILMGKA